MKAKLILENGITFYGNAFGYLKDSIGEVVFNTSMTGYEEILTDPSYYGQIVTMTYPLIGNYGINLEDMESNSPRVKGLIVREKCDFSSNFRSELEISDYLKQNKIIGIEGIDTRALTKILRNSGTMKGIITVEDSSYEKVKDRLKNFVNKKAVEMVTTKERYEIQGQGKHVAVMDFGIKGNIITSFKKRNCKITVFPAFTHANEILKINPDLVFLSNGPGDPEDLPKVIENIKILVKEKPVVGICLGHQLLALALGGKTSRLKFGHRGGNHPVKDLSKDKIYITSQNHGYFVSTVPEGVTVTHININDDTVEGMKHNKLPIFSIQFHPEACPGPKDNDYIFDEFLKYSL